MPSLTHADIVVVANHHNPSIVSPEWVKEHLGLVETPSQFLHTMELSVWDSAICQVQVDRSRLQVTTKRLNAQGLERIASVALAYVRTLEHVPFAAVGLNFHFEILNPRALELAVDGQNVPRTSEGYSFRFGGVLIGEGEADRMRVVVEPGEGARTTLAFNVHADVTGAEEARRALDNLSQRWRSCEAIAQTFGGG